MKAAVVILNYNGEKLLQRFLPSVVGNTPDADIYIADNGSDDHSLNMVGKHFPTVRLIPFPENYGFCKGYNEAMKQVKADVCVLLNSDVEVSPGWLQPIVTLMEQDADIAAVQPKVLAFNDRSRFEHSGAAGGFIDSLGYPYCRGRIFDKVEEDKGQYDDITEIFWTSGACMAVRKEWYQHAGGFDEDFFAHMEEIDLCWKFHRMNKKVFYTGHSVVYHVGAGTLAYDHPRKTYFNFRNNLMMVFKHWNTGEVFLKLPARILLDWVAAVSFVLKGKAAHARAIFQAHGYFISHWSKNRNKRKELHRLYPPCAGKGIYKGLVLFDYLFARKSSYPQ